MFDPFEVKLARERLLTNSSSIEGLGVFARFGFREGDLITIMQGDVVDVPGLKRLYDQGMERLSDPLQLSERTYLDLEEPFVRINHSCDPNTAIVGKAHLIALKPIEAGEEFTFDYSLTEWTWNRFGRYYHWDMECICGSPKCRGIISQFPFLPLRVKAHYYRKGTLPDFMFRMVTKAGLGCDVRVK